MKERYRHAAIYGCSLMLGLSACTDMTWDRSRSQPSPSYAASDIDGLYLQTAQILQQPDRDQAGSLHSLTIALDKFKQASAGLDPCLQQKRRQLMPIVMSMGVINGLRDAGEKKMLRGEALQHLAELSSPDVVAMTGDVCFGQGFPPIVMGKP